MTLDESPLGRIARLESRVAELERLLHSKCKTTVTEGPDPKRMPTTPQSLRVAAIFHRKPTTPWSEKEIKAYKKLGVIHESEMAMIEAFYASGDEYLRRDLYTFLNNFTGELDRARAWQKGNHNGRTHKRRDSGDLNLSDRYA